MIKCGGASEWLHPINEIFFLTAHDEASLSKVPPTVIGCF